MTYLKMKGQEASSWLKMVTRKMKLEVLPDTVHKLSPPQARKNCFIWMGHLYGAFGPGTTCWPGGGLKCSPGVGGSKMASRGVDWLLAPPTPTYGRSSIPALAEGDFRPASKLITLGYLWNSLDEPNPMAEAIPFL